jgi:hypothetical protein
LSIPRLSVHICGSPIANQFPQLDHRRGRPTRVSAHTPHDALIRKTFDDPANVLVELRAVLPPALFAQLDPRSLSLRQGTFVDPELHRSHTDVLYSGRIAGHDAYFYFLLEHLSTQDQLAPFRLLVPVVLWALRDARDAERIAASLLTWAHLLAEIAHSPRGVEALRAVFTHISLVSDRLSRHDLLQAIERLAPPVKELLITPAQQWIQEGEQRGIELGKAAGERQLLLRLLRAKFGALPESVEARVNAAVEPELLTWSERVLTATSLDELFV